MTDELDALANSLSDDDSVNSFDENVSSAWSVGPDDIETEINVNDIEEVETKDELSRSINVAGDLDTTGSSEEASIIDKPEPESTELKREEVNSQESVISVNLDGIDPDSILMPDCDLKSCSLSSLPSGSGNLNDVSFDSALSVDKTSIKKTTSGSAQSMSSLQEMFDNISSTHESVDEACDEIEVELDVDVVEDQGSNTSESNQKDALFSDYTLDDIITGKIAEEISDQPESRNDDEEEGDDEDDDEDIV